MRRSAGRAGLTSSFRDRRAAPWHRTPLANMFANMFAVFLFGVYPKRIGEPNRTPSLEGGSMFAIRFTGSPKFNVVVRGLRVEIFADFVCRPFPNTGNEVANHGLL